MRYLLHSSLFLILISCNSSNSTEPSVEQKKIDSLTAEVTKRDEAMKKQEEDRKVEEQKRAEEKLLTDERNSLFKNVTVDRARFDPVSFGGFKNISYTFFNDYNHVLDQVIMTVHYIKKNGSDAKTETIVLKDVEARSRQTIRPPDYILAGTYINVSFESIQCKQIDLCFYRGVGNGSGLGNGGGAGKSISRQDPYKCN